MSEGSLTGFPAPSPSPERAGTRLHKLPAMTTLLLVHGAFHGAWCWDRLRPELSDRGIAAQAVDLPFTSLADDEAAVVAEVE